MFIRSCLSPKRMITKQSVAFKIESHHIRSRPILQNIRLTTDRKVSRFKSYIHQAPEQQSDLLRRQSYRECLSEKEKRLNISYPVSIIAQHNKPKPVSIKETVPALNLVMLRSKVQFKRNQARPLQTIYKELANVSPAFSPMFRTIDEITETSESSISLKKINFGSTIKQSNFLTQFRRKSSRQDQHIEKLISCDKIKLPDLSPIHELKSARQLDQLLKSYLKETKKRKQVSCKNLTRSLQKNEYSRQIKIDKEQIRLFNKNHSPSMKLMKSF